MSATPSADDGESRAATVRQELARATPKLALILLILLLVLLFRSDLSQLIGRTTKVGYGGFSLEAAQKTLERAKSIPAGDLSSKIPPMSEEERERIIGRFQRLAERVHSARILWMDNEPANNAAIVDFLELTVGPVDVARSVEEALSRLQERTYQVVITEYGQPDKGPSETTVPAKARGPQLASEIAVRAATGGGCAPAVIMFSVGVGGKPTPEHVLRQTERTYALLHAIADVLETGDAPSCGAGDPAG
jgi:CheY-like chemotaxis protein